MSKIGKFEEDVLGIRICFGGDGGGGDGGGGADGGDAGFGDGSSDDGGAAACSATANAVGTEDGGTVSISVSINGEIGTCACAVTGYDAAMASISETVSQATDAGLSVNFGGYGSAAEAAAAAVAAASTEGGQCYY